LKAANIARDSGMLSVSSVKGLVQAGSRRFGAAKLVLKYD